MAMRSNHRRSRSPVSLLAAARLALCLALCLCAAPASAQSKVGTAIGQFLLIEPSARAAGMGAAGVALADGIQAVYANAAAIGELESAGFQLTHSEWFAEIDFDYVALAVPVGSNGNLLASVTGLSSGEIDVRTVDRPLGTGERYSVRDLAIGLGYGRHITDRFSAGLQVKYLQETIWHTSLRTMTLDVGALYTLNADGWTLGASLSNYGTKGRYRGRDLAIQYDNIPGQNGDNSALPGERLTDEFPVPVLFRVGLSYPYQLNDNSQVLLAVDALHPSDNTESLSLGAEWSWKRTLALRAGFQDLAREDTETGLTMGAGLMANMGARRLHFDYAWADHGRLQETHRMTVVLDF